jgi:co-chaperonin GroES (HSP10)
MMKPRNTLVLVRLVKKEEEKIGQIVVKTDKDQFCEAEVIAVGPDTISADGGESGTRDLKAGQRVLVQYQTIMVSPDGIQRKTKPQGLKLKETIAGERDLYLFEQHNIMAILAEPEEIK